MKKMLKSVACFILTLVMVLSLCPSTLQLNAATKKAKLASKSVTINVGSTKKIQLKNKPKGGKYTYKTYKSSIATVTKAGTIKGVKAGTTYVKVTVKPKKRKSYTLKLKVIIKNVKVTKITLKATSLNLTEGDSYTIQKTITPSNATNKKVTYTSSNTAVASVSSAGVVTAVAAGTAKITVTAADGSKKSASMTVNVISAKGDYGKTEDGKLMPRAIITQDAEVDDMNSVVHLLLYSNEIEIQGIVQTSSRYHWQGVAGKVNPGTGVYNTTSAWNANYRWPGTQWMYDYIDAYAKVYANLKAQDSAYPNPVYLKSITKVGNIGYEGEMDSSTDGSNLIKDAILANDDRPLYLLACGGSNTIGRALKDIEAQYKNTAQWSTIRANIVKKVIIGAWGTQDKVYETYIGEEYPEIQYYDVSKTCYGYAWSTKLQDGDPDSANPNPFTEEAYKKFSNEWMYNNIDHGHGALLDKYVTWGDGTYLTGEADTDQFGLDKIVGTKNWWGGFFHRTYQQYDFLSEGDSPAFFALFNTGLRSLENLGYGSYAGRYALDTTKINSKGQQENYWVEQNDTDTDGTTRISDIKWLVDIQNEFATRALWCTTSSRSAANHEPSLTVKEGCDLVATAGTTVSLTLAGSDPDGDFLKYSTSVYNEASTYTGEGSIQLTGANSNKVSIAIPSDAKAGTKINVICKVTDDDKLALSHYAQVIITVN